VKNYRFVGVMAVIMSGFMVLMYCIPGSGGDLAWQEWAMVGGWAVLGVVFYGLCKRKYGEKFGILVELATEEELASGALEPVGEIAVEN
jgi:hypothetical protein